MTVGVGAGVAGAGVGAGGCLAEDLAGCRVGGAGLAVFVDWQFLVFLGAEVAKSQEIVT